MEVVKLREGNFRNPVYALRQLADDIEAGKFGEVGCVATVVLGDQLAVFAGGRDSEAPSAALLLHAGFMRLSMEFEKHGK